MVRTLIIKAVTKVNKMKIINLEEFLKLPEYTYFCKTSPDYFGDLCIKGENVGEIDFNYLPLSMQIDFQDDYAKLEKGEDVILEIDVWCRDGMFDKTQKFVIFTTIEIKNYLKQYRF